MKTVRIELGEDERLDTIRVEMTAREAVYLAKLTGRLDQKVKESIMSGASEINSEVYDCLSSLFNRFYENGVDEAVREIA